MPFFDLVKPDIEKLKAKQDVEGLIKALHFREEKTNNSDIYSLKNEDTAIRAAAAEALGEIGDPCAIDPLIEVLARNYSKVTAVINASAARAASAQALGKLGDAKAVDILITAIERDPLDAAGEKNLHLASHIVADHALLREFDKAYMNVCLAAIQALGQLKDRRAIKPLLTLVDSKYDQKREAAISALIQLGDVSILESLLEHSRQDVRDAVIKGLATLEHSIDKGKLAVAKNDWGEVRRLGTSAFELAIKALQSGDYDQRVGAILMLGSMEDKRAIDSLVAILDNNDNPYLRHCVARSLFRLGDKRGLDTLLADLQNEKTRGSAVTVLEDIRDNRAVEPLLAILDASPYPTTYDQRRDHEVLITALGKIGDSRATEKIIRWLVSFEETAAEALLRIDDPRIPQLLFNEINTYAANERMADWALHFSRTLTLFLKKKGSTVSTDDLRQIAQLNNSQKESFQESAYGDFVSYETVDFSALRDAAKHELEQRGSV